MSAWSRLSQKRRGVIAVSVIVLVFLVAIVGSVLAHGHHTSRQCVDTRSMKVAVSGRCRDQTGTADVYRWYYGSAVTQVGGTARGGSGGGDEGGFGGGGGEGGEG
jgi:uncharacterized membrane protein YgcG